MKSENCTDPAVGKLIHAYELNTLPDEDADRFEAHLLVCDYCFNEVTLFAERAEIITTNRKLVDGVAALINEESRKKSVWSRFWNYLWPLNNNQLKPIVLLCLVLLMAIPAYWGIKDKFFDGTQQDSLQTIQLSPTRGTNIASIKYIEDSNVIIYFTIPEFVEDRSYYVTVKRKSGPILNKICSGYVKISSSREYG